MLPGIRGDMYRGHAGRCDRLYLYDLELTGTECDNGRWGKTPKFDLIT